MNLEYDFDDIDDYLQDRMSDADRAAFERALETNPELVQRVEVIKAEAKVLRLLRDEYLRNQFEDWGKEIVEKKHPVCFPGQV
ncbi:MAG: anti-sigma factor family protein [Saprospiraceae bacterium]